MMSNKIYTVIMAASCMVMQTKSSAQGYFQLSYDRASYECDNLNRSVYVYNYTRQWLTNKMDYFGHSQGFQMSYGYLRESLGFEIGLIQHFETHKAWGLEPDSGHDGYRRFEYYNYGYYIAFPLRFVHEEKVDFIFWPAFKMTKNSINLTYATNPEFDNANSETVVNQGSPGIDLGLAVRYFPLKWLGFELRPNLGFNFHQADVSPVQIYLQGAWSSAYFYDSFMRKGITFSLIFANRETY